MKAVWKVEVMDFCKVGEMVFGAAEKSGEFSAVWKESWLEVGVAE